MITCLCVNIPSIALLILLCSLSIHGCCGNNDGLFLFVSGRGASFRLDSPVSGYVDVSEDGCYDFFLFFREYFSRLSFDIPRYRRWGEEINTFHSIYEMLLFREYKEVVAVFCGMNWTTISYSNIPGSIYSNQWNNDGVLSVVINSIPPKTKQNHSLILITSTVDYFKEVFRCADVKVVLPIDVERMMVFQYYPQYHSKIDSLGSFDNGFGKVLNFGFCFVLSSTLLASWSFSDTVFALRTSNADIGQVFSTCMKELSNQNSLCSSESENWGSVNYLPKETNYEFILLRDFRRMFSRCDFLKYVLGLILADTSNMSNLDEALELCSNLDKETSLMVRIIFENHYVEFDYFGWRCDDLNSKMYISCVIREMMRMIILPTKLCLIQGKGVICVVSNWIFMMRKLRSIGEGQGRKD